MSLQHLPAWCVASLVLAAAAPALPAQEIPETTVRASAGPSRAGEQIWHTVPDAHLDRMRGGFDVGGGLMVSLGIQQATYINGQLVTQTAISLTQLNQLTSAQAATLRERLNTLTVVQNGPGNRFGAIQSPADGSALVSQIAGAGAGTVIQNSLSGQRIQQLTTIDASSNGMGLLRAGQWQQTLRDSMGAVGGMR
ncbi:hypothetical protein [Comamonas terrigena]|uniref:hypothetical protein n=1 Tax=Comamonas terrigena TaxID=32013 RepID=UPI00244CFF7B|nr:hypothetical protein [Comamonas terrigena]MDH0048909.1 hypothetical protein [Comamonas terrigena]MDH0511834.1 hypothetical protein [Comamonas terrigena]MDH1091165.1 hypothetical protein [Comamonas terrigena]MDH1501884.1 hypothetical protein [Comamonas terrigena]